MVWPWLQRLSLSESEVSARLRKEAVSAIYISAGRPGSEEESQTCQDVVIDASDLSSALSDPAASLPLSACLPPRPPTSAANGKHGLFTWEVVRPGPCINNGIQLG